MSSTISAVASATSSAATGLNVNNPNLKIVGIILAIVSGLLIGSSFVFKKKGLLSSLDGNAAGEGVAYLKSPLWWIGMGMMILGEICNFAAYAFVEAIVVTPLGALSVVICAILSSIFLKEALTFFGWMGCGLCIIGSVIIALNGPKEESVGQIKDFQELFLAPGFLSYAGVLIVASLAIIFYFAPKHGTKSMLWYISVCSMIGGLSVSVTTGLGAAIVTTAGGDNQFNHWFMYFLIAFVAVTLITEVFYLNKALALFNTAMVTPTYYVIFTFFSMVTTIVLFQGLKAPAVQIITIVMGFLVICFGITILQMSKVDPENLVNLDRKSTILLAASRSNTENVDEKIVTGMEDPGMDALRGSFGAFGSIVRARSARRMSQSSTLRPRPQGAAAPRMFNEPESGWSRDSNLVDSPDVYPNMKRHQLWDAPVPSRVESMSLSARGMSPQTPNRNLSPGGTVNSPERGRRPTIKFEKDAVLHSYHPTVVGDASATHESRPAMPQSSTAEAGHITGMPYPPSPMPRERTKSTPSSPKSPSQMYTMEQNATLPSHFSQDDLRVRTAPLPGSTHFNMNTSPTHKYADSREIFSDNSTTQLATFPSMSDSSTRGQSQWDNDDDTLATARAARARNPSRPRAYPRVSVEDDTEESVSLWHKSGPSVDESDSNNALSGGGGARLSAGMSGGIRLVQPSSGRRY